MSLEITLTVKVTEVNIIFYADLKSVFNFILARTVFEMRLIKICEMNMQYIMYCTQIYIRIIVS